MTLQDLCLNTIVNAFERFNLAFTTGKDVSLMKRLEFLQRAYSFQIVQKLSEEYNMLDKYADFVINRYLKVLDTEWLSCCSMETIKRKFAEIGPSLEKWYINEMKNEIRWADFLCYVPNIKVVFFTSFCDDEFLVQTSQYCHKIETLNIKNSLGVSDYGVRLLCVGNDRPACPLLKELFLENAAVGCDSIRDLLLHSPSLEKCDYTELAEVLYEMHKSDIETLDKVKPYNLTHLDLMHVAYSEHFNEILQICVTLCPRLKVFSCPIFNEEHLKLCSDLTKIEDLNLDCCIDSWIEINEFLTLRGNKLTSLGIRNFSFSASVLALKCPHLNVLRMNVVNLQYDDSDSIPILHNLKEFSLEKCVFLDTLTSKSVSCFLSSCPNLEQLCFKSCEFITSEIITQILKCCEQCPIEQISFANSSVEPQLFKDILLTCSTLICMNLDGCSIEADFEREIFRIASSLPNVPEIIVSDEMSSVSGYAYEDFLDGYNDIFDDEYDTDDVDYDDVDGDDLDDENGW